MKSENTRYRLAQSMAECMRTTPVESITIRQIVDKCGVTRQTFYRNFIDKYDLIDWLKAGTLLLLLSIIWTSSKPQTTSLMLDRKAVPEAVRLLPAVHRKKSQRIRTLTLAFMSGNFSKEISKSLSRHCKI